MNLLRQIANVTNQVFSYQNPVLDVSFANYRLSAMHELSVDLVIKMFVALLLELLQKNR